MSYLIFLLLFISTLLWAITDETFLDKGVAIIFSWMISPLFVIFLITTGNMTSTDLAVVAGGGGVVIPLVIGAIKKTIALINFGSSDDESVQPIFRKNAFSAKKLKEEADIMERCKAMRSSMDTRIEDIVQDIELIKKQVWNVPNAQLLASTQYTTELNQAAQQLGLLQNDFEHHVARIEGMMSPLETQDTQCIALRKQMHDQRASLQTHQQEMTRFIQAYEQRLFDKHIDKAKAVYQEIHQQLKKELAIVKELNSQPSKKNYNRLKHTKRELALLTNRLEEHNSKTITQLLPLGSLTPFQDKQLKKIYKKLSDRLKNAQLTLHQLEENFRQQYIEQSPVHQQLQYEEKKEKLEQKQVGYLEAAKQLEAAQQAVSNHIESLWAIYRQHHPNDSTQNTVQLTAFLRQAYPKELEQFRQKREHQAMIKTKHRAIEKEIEVLKEEVSTLQIKYTFNKNSEESIRQLWQSYEHANDPEEFWHTYQQRLDELNEWRQTAYLLK